MPERWVFFNGAFYLEKEVAIPVTDRGFLFGEGIFTTIRINQGKGELLKYHLERLQRQAEELNFELNFVSFDWINELIQYNQAWEGVWRLKVIVTVKEEHNIRRMGCLLATLHPFQDLSFCPCHLCLFPYPMQSPLAHLKTLSYLDHLYVREFARRQGYEDAITCTQEGFLLETGCSNLFWMDQNKYWIPDRQLPYLKGVFLQSLLPQFSLPIQWIKATIDQIPTSANVYICNSLTHIRPVLSIGPRLFSRNDQIEGILRQRIAAHS